jgi:hypothetical protein
MGLKLFQTFVEGARKASSEYKAGDQPSDS